MSNKKNIFIILAISLLAPSLFADLIANWKMDEALWNGTSNEVIDSSGNGHHGQAVSGAVTVANGQIDRAGSFSPNAHLTVSDSSDWDLGSQFTIALWVKMDALNRDNEFVAHGPNDNDFWEFRWGAGTTEGLQFRVVSGGSLILNMSQNSQDGWTTNGFHHAAIVKDGVNLTLYRDGEVISVNTDGDSIPNLSSSLFIGKRGSRFHDGLMDDVGIWDEALSTSQINNALSFGAENFEAPPIPEPTTSLLFALGILGCAFRLRGRV